MDEVFGALFLCIALVLVVTGVYVLGAGRVPGWRWILSSWRDYPPRRAGLGIAGTGVLLAVMGFDRVTHGRWTLVVGGLLCLALATLFVGWLVVTWKRAVRAEVAGESRPTRTNNVNCEPG